MANSLVEYSLKSISLVIGVILTGTVYCQCPNADFTVDNVACIGQLLNVKNISSNTDSVIWDFCGDDLLEAPSVISTSSPGNLSQPFGYTTIFDNGKWYGFMTSRGNGRLFRADFGSDLANTPTYIDLGTFGGMLNQPEDIDLLKVGVNWYAIVTLNLSAPDNGLVLVDFGSDIETLTPVVSTLGNFGITTKIRGVSAVLDGADIILAISSSNRDVHLINFRDSFANPITSFDIKSILSISGSNGIFSLDLHRECLNWYLFATSFSNGNIHRLKFGTSLFTSPIQIDTYTVPGIVQPFDIDIISEAGVAYGFISNLGQPYKLLNFGNLELNQVPTTVVNANPTATVVTKLHGVKYKGGYHLNGIDQSIKVLNQITYSNNSCLPSIEFSQLTEPQVRYSADGSHKMILDVVYDNYRLSHFELIEVSSNIAPDPSFSRQNVCVDRDVNFEINNSVGITSYAWNFGDANSSTIENPVHQYTSPGDYSVSLEVTALTGCKNLAQQTVSIFNGPIADFNLPNVNPFCTNQQYIFENTSTTDPGFPATWEWVVNDVEQGTTEHLEFIFDQQTQQEITLTASIPGCENSITKSISSLSEGPIVEFIYNGQCEVDEVSFTNSSSGEISSYQWDFGDGRVSSVQNPVNTFQRGIYQVTLQANSPNGCQNTKTKPITIYSLPQPNFQLELPPFSCSGMPSQFTDLSPSPVDSNITGWSWRFGDDGSGTTTSTLKNPTHVYDNAGQYDVTLTAETNYGCIDSITKTVTIAQTPAVEILNTPACDDVPTTFSTSSSSELQSWNWQIGITQFSIPEPTYLFTNSGSYNVQLDALGANNCIASMSKSVIVPQSLIPDFAVNRNCVNQSTEFNDVTVLYDDPISTYSWSFGDAGSGSGSPVLHSYQNTGNYNVNLNLITVSGCTYSRMKSIAVGNPPQASFTASPDVGVPPLNVNFINTSSGASQYLWNFNDENNTTSTETSPQFTFLDYGNYVVDLTAYNAQNCSHTVSKVVTAALPFIDVGLENLVISENANGLLSGQVVIHNKGNLTIQNLNLAIDLSGIEIQQIVTEPIPPYSSILYTLNFNLVEGNKLEYICVEADLTGDNNKEDNSLCTSFEDKTIVIAPYPNPASGSLYVDWISPDEHAVQIFIHDPLGRLVFENKIEGSAGLNSVSLNLERLTQGPYVMSFNAGYTKKVFRFVVNR